MTDSSVTGIWQGLYSYPAFAAHVPFTATLLDLGGLIDGTTHEGGHALTADGALEGVVSGRRETGSVTFVKRYRGGGNRFLPITYSGVINGDGTEIEGRWTISHDCSGTFLMIRPEREPVEVTERVTERA